MWLVFMKKLEELFQQPCIKCIDFDCLDILVACIIKIWVTWIVIAVKQRRKITALDIFFWLFIFCYNTVSTIRPFIPRKDVVSQTLSLGGILWHWIMSNKAKIMHVRLSGLSSARGCDTRFSQVGPSKFKASKSF